MDDEGLQVNLWLFSAPVTLAADNAAFALSDADLVKVVAVIPFVTFFDAANGMFSQVAGISLPIETGPDCTVYAALQARGALNIAVLNLPRFSLGILAD